MEQVSTARRNAKLLAFAILATFATIRISLHAFPGTDLNVFGYNIHHLFTGILLTTASSIPLAVGVPAGRLRDALLLALGAGLALVLDEWVYLIVTDGSNSAYLLPVSYLGAAAMIALALALITVTARVGASHPSINRSRSGLASRQ
ncbi:MAG TPA: hypothetical protein VGB92_21415 [Longimicrobium sp.]